MDYNLHRRWAGLADIEDGSEQHPFLIKNAIDFIAFKQSLLYGNSWNGYFFKVINDIDFNTYQIPQNNGLSGYSEVPFSGTFDGNFKVFKNISMTNTLTTRVFALTTGAVVKNLFFKDINVENTAIGSSRYECALFTGVGILEQIAVTGNFTARRFSASPLGGSYEVNLTIRNCYINVNIKGVNYPSGGILGQNASGCRIENCFTTGTINNNNGETGGICGYSSQSNFISNCVSAFNSIYTSNAARGRIKGNAGNNLNNYALSTMTVNGVTIGTGTAANRDGASATESQLKSLAFYRNTMGWNMDNIWEIEDGVSYPRLKGFNYDF